MTTTTDDIRHRVERTLAQRRARMLDTAELLAAVAVDLREQACAAGDADAILSANRARAAAVSVLERREAMEGVRSIPASATESPPIQSRSEKTCGWDPNPDGTQGAMT